LGFVLMIVTSVIVAVMAMVVSGVIVMIVWTVL